MCLKKLDKKSRIESYDFQQQLAIIQHVWFSNTNSPVIGSPEDRNSENLCGQSFITYVIS